MCDRFLNYSSMLTSHQSCLLTNISSNDFENFNTSSQNIYHNHHKILTSEYVFTYHTKRTSITVKLTADSIVN